MLRIRISLLVMIGAVLWMTACGQNNEAAIMESDVLMLPAQANYKTCVAEKADFRTMSEGAVHVVYPVTEELRCDRDNLRFEELLVTKGSYVREGDPLVSFRVEGSRALLEESQLAYRRAVETLERETAERQEEIAKAVALSEEKGLSAEEEKIARKKVEILQVSLEQYRYESEREISRLRQELQELEKELQDNILTAPFNGIVQYVAPFSAGDRIPVGAVVVTMHATDTFLMKADDAKEVLDYNLEVTVETGNSQNRKSYTGRVIAAPNILPLGVTQENRYIKLDEEVPAEEFKKSTTYYCYTEEVGNALLIDRKAVHREGESYYVYVLEEEILKKRYVVIGLENNNRAWIVDGLSEGQVLVLD